MFYRWKRLKNRLRFLCSIREIFGWEYESCNRCGKCYRLTYEIKDETWIAVNGGDGGLLCFDCFIQTAEEKGIEIVLEDIETLWVFQNEGERAFDIRALNNNSER